MGIFSKIGKKKIGFWAGDQNNFQFVDSLIESLSKKYRVQKFDYDGDVKLLYRQMLSVDVCWFEWGNGPVVPATQSDIDKPMINRIHRYELYSDSPNHIIWPKVNKLLFSSPSMIGRFEEKFPEYSKQVDYELVGIGVDTDLFEFKDKTKTGKQILYVGRVHPHKNPALLLQIFAKLYSKDPEYTLKIIGGFSDELFEEYFYDQIKKLGIENSIQFLGRLTHEEMVEHVQESDYFLITSIIEGISQASLEAMSCGVCPVIFNYYNADKGYPDKCIYNTVDEAVDMLMKPSMSRQEARDFIVDKYNVKVMDERVATIIEGLIK